MNCLFLYHFSVFYHERNLWLNMWCCVFLSTMRGSYSIQRRLEKQWWDFGLNPLSLRSQITQSVPSRNQYKTFQRFTFLGRGSRTLPGNCSLFVSLLHGFCFFFSLLSCSSPIYPLLQRASNIYLFLPLSDTFVDCTICLSSRSDCGKTGQHTRTHTHEVFRRVYHYVKGSVKRWFHDPGKACD